jgi:alkylhydroperoxidase family enzyme
MAWIRAISEQEATGTLKQIYDSFHQRFSAVPNIMQSLSLKPELLSAVSRLFTTGTFGASNLSRVQEEMIATVVSALNRCHY